MVASNSRIARRRRRRRRRALFAGGGLVVLIAVAFGARVALEGVPPLHDTRLVALLRRAPGVPPQLRWPAGGAGALEAAGVGTFLGPAARRVEPIASVAKLMTAYLVLRDYPLAAGADGFQITVSPADVADYEARVALGESVLEVAAGERLSERQLLEALLLPSANNVAALLARKDAGSVAAFVAKMNAQARALGMSATHYSDPSGFASSTTSTAADQLRLLRVVLNSATLRTIAAETSVVLPVAGLVTNYDSLLGTDGFVGLKTGSDSSAGGCFAFADDRRVGGRPIELIGVVLGLDRGQSSTSVLVGAALGAARRLADSLAGSLALRTIVPAGSPVLRVDAPTGSDAIATNAVALRAISVGGEQFALALREGRLGRSLAAGAVIGDLALRGGGASPLRSDAAIAAPSLGWRLAHAF